jgi:hypothetical protein
MRANTMSNNNEYHCRYCYCPKDLWSKWMKTYDGDECKLYDSFTAIINEFEDAKTLFTNSDIYKKCTEVFARQFNDIVDIDATIKEMIDVNNSECFMPSNYVLLEIIR